MTILNTCSTAHPNSFSAYRANNILSSNKFIIYGYGEGFTALKRTVLLPCSLIPILVVDQQFDSKPADNSIRCLSTEQFYLKSKEYMNTPIVITIGNRMTANKIIDNLSKLGLKKVVWAPDIYEFSLHHSNEKLLADPEEYFKSHENSIQKAFTLLSDELSRNTFAAILTRYLTAYPLEIPSLPFKDQYLPYDIPMAKKPSHYVSCGAFNGDSITKIFNAFGKFETIYAFEPDPNNFSELNKTISSYSSSLGKSIISVPCGVHSKTGLLNFSSGNGLSSSVDPMGQSYVQVIRLDDFISTDCLTYITMDVEGSELEALAGATNILEKNQPDLGISVYHYPHHLWAVIDLINNLNLGYKFYLRNYSGFTYETVLYATIAK